MTLLQMAGFTASLFFRLIIFSVSLWISSLERPLLCLGCVSVKTSSLPVVSLASIIIRVHEKTIIQKLNSIYIIWFIIPGFNMFVLFIPKSYNILLILISCWCPIEPQKTSHRLELLKQISRFSTFLISGFFFATGGFSITKHLS